jgi:tripartite-type tricarboxylate transporter receptor subunit TctC
MTPKYAAIMLAVALSAGIAPARAEYPDRPVTFVVPFAPGGSTDILTRMLAEALRNQLKQPFVVENRPGASMQIGTAAVAKSPPDGSMLVMSSATSLAVNPNIYKSLPYDPIKDLAPVSLVGSAYFVLVANPALGPKTLPELIAYIKARPGQLSYASAGHGTPHHLFMELFMKMAGLKMQHVPYKGSVPALTDVMSGVIPVMMVDLLPSMQLIRDGKVTAFGVTTGHRVKVVPDIPTIAEAALPGYSALGWFAVMARAGTPRPAIERAGQDAGDGGRAAHQHARRARCIHSGRNGEVGSGGARRRHHTGMITHYPKVGQRQSDRRSHNRRAHRP